MYADKAFELAQLKKTEILEDVAKTEEFKTNVSSIDFKILSFCELGDLSCFFDVDNESQDMIDALIYYYRCRGYKVSIIIDEKKYILIKWDKY